MSNSLWPHGLHHARLPCPSPTPGAYWNSCPLSWWCQPTISSSIIPFSSHLQSSNSIRVFSNEPILRIIWPKYWSFSFSFSSSNEYLGLVYFRMDWLDLLAVQELSRVFSKTTVQKHQSFSTQPSLWSNCTSIHEYWKNHSFDYTHFVGKIMFLLLLCCLGCS